MSTNLYATYLLKRASAIRGQILSLLWPKRHDDLGAGEFDYAAFMSYSHAGDNGEAKVLEALLERFPNSWYRLRRRRIYLDQGDLAANSDLRSTIQHALSRSRYFLLMASPQSAESPWVEEEIRWWLENRTTDTIVIVLTEGRIAVDALTGRVDVKGTDALPRVLVDALSAEPLWVSLPDVQEGATVDPASPAWEDVLARLVSRLDGVDKDAIIGEHVRNRSKALRLRAGIIAVLSVLLVVALVAGVLALAQRNDAQKQALVATSRLLIAESAAVQDSQPDLARQLLAEAYRRNPTDQVVGALIKSVSLSDVIRTEGLAWQVTVLQKRNLLAIGADGAVQLYDLLSGRSIILDPEFGGARSVAFSPNGRQLTVESSRFIRIYDISNPEKPSRVWTYSQAGTTSSSTVRYLSGEAIFMTVGSVTGVWDTSNLANVHRIDNFPSNISAGKFAISADSRHLATTSANKANGEIGVALWDISDVSHVRELGSTADGHTQGVNSIAFDPTGNMLATAGSDDTARLWDVSNPMAPIQRAVLAGHSSGAYSVAFSHDGFSLAVGTGNGAIHLWKVVDSFRPAPGAVLTGHSGFVYSVAFALNDRRLLSASQDGVNTATASSALPYDNGSVRVWPVAGVDRASEVVRVRSASSGSPALAPSSDLLAAGFPTQIWSFKASGEVKQLGTLSTFNIGGQAVSFSNDGQQIFSGSPLVRWDVSDPASPKALDPEIRRTDGVTSVGISPTGKIAALSGLFGAVELWSTEGKSSGPITVLPGSKTNSNGGWSFSPDGSRIVSLTDKPYAAVWNISDPKRPVEETQLTVREGGVSTLVFVDSDHIVAGSNTGELSTWNVDEPGAPVLVSSMKRQAGRIGSLAVERGQSVVASAADDGSVVLWSLRDPRTPLELATLAVGGQYSSTSVGFSADGKYFAASSAGETSIWTTDLPAILGRICARTVPMSEAEWTTYLPDSKFDLPCE